MRTKKEIRAKIKELESKKYNYEMNGGGWVDSPYPYDEMIKLLKWTMKE